MHAFYAELLEGQEGRVRLLPDESKHARKVLRLRDGEEICVLDGAGHRWRAILDGGDEALIAEALPDNEPRVRLTVYQGLPKADKLELIAQKLTELGAAAVIPVNMQRSVAREGGRRDERAQRIAREAVKQCRRARIPEIPGVLSWKDALERMRSAELLLIPWEDAREAHLADVLKDRPEAKDIALVIGPEGGIAPEEIDQMRAIGGQAVTLGARILRTETAAIAATAAIMALLGEM